MGIDPALVDKLVDAQKIPLENTRKRRDSVVAEKQEVETLEALLNELDSSANKLKTRYDFNKLRLDSSHPDIIDGTVEPTALLGTYEFEVRALAKAEKELAYGFADKDQSPVGLGYMLIERDDGEEVEVVVKPYSTLEGVASEINDADAGVKAMVINTKYKPNPYRLLVISEQSGKEAKVYIDPDTTFLEFKEQVTGRNLDVLFEDVPVTDEDNNLEELVDSVVFNVRRSEPGTRVQVSVVHDLDATLEGIKAFIEKYNQVASFIHAQFIENPETGEYGKLSGDSSIKYIMRQLQSAVVPFPKGGSNYSTLAHIGITTDPKTGQLKMDESKVRSSLAEDYDGVAELFVTTRDSSGVAEALSQKLRSFRDPEFGTIKSRLRGLTRIIETQDKEIERRQRQLESREKTIRQRFARLENQLADLKGQKDFLAARLGQGQTP